MKKFLFSLALLSVLTVPAFAVTVFNSDGSLRYSDDPSVTATVNGAVSEFLTKPFEEYTVTEGFCSCSCCWACVCSFGRS